MEQLTEFYPDRLCCVFMLMLQWESACRPDFVELIRFIDYIYELNDHEQEQRLFSSLCGFMVANESAQKVKALPISSIVRVKAGQTPKTQSFCSEESKVSETERM